MPIYEYVCDQGHRFEVIHGIHDAGPAECPVCHSINVRKAFAPPTIHFKGSGWAKKDRKATSSTASSTKADATDGSSTAASSSSSSSSSKEVGAKTDGSTSTATDSGSSTTTSSSSTD